MLVSLLVTILVIGLLVYLVQMLPLPQPWKQIALVVVIIIGIVWLLRFLGVIPLGML